MAEAIATGLTGWFLRAYPEIAYSPAVTTAGCLLLSLIYLGMFFLAIEVNKPVKLPR